MSRELDEEGRHLETRRDLSPVNYRGELSNGGDDIALADSTGNVVDYVDFNDDGYKT